MNSCNMWQHLKQETENLMKKIELLKDSKWFIIFLFYPSSQISYIHCQVSLTTKRIYCIVLFIPQEALGRRFKVMLFRRTAIDRTTVGNECKQCSCKKGQVNKLFFYILIFQFDEYLNPNFLLFRIRFTRNKLIN